MSKSKIEWTEQAWNPIRGCSMAPGSETGGCLNCYAARFEARGITSHRFPDGQPAARMMPNGPRFTGRVELLESMLDIPLRRHKPTTYFVNSMADLFHEALPNEAIDRVFAVMALCPQHTFQVLTKRAERMRVYVTKINSSERFGDINEHARDICAAHKRIVRSSCGIAVLPTQAHGMVPGGWPLPNVWPGVSCEDQQTADQRIPLLLRTPAAVHFVSLEPMLGPLDVRKWMKGQCPQCHGFDDYCADVDLCETCKGLNPIGLDWVILGGESGPGARPMHPQWARSVRDQCVAAGVPFFFKQWGEWSPECEGFYRISAHRYSHRTFAWGKDSREYNPVNPAPDDFPKVMFRVGKRAAGHLLDGKEWRQMPVSLRDV